MRILVPWARSGAEFHADPDLRDDSEEEEDDDESEGVSRPSQYGLVLSPNHHGSDAEVHSGAEAHASAYSFAAAPFHGMNPGEEEEEEDRDFDDDDDGGQGGNNDDEDNNVNGDEAPDGVEEEDRERPEEDGHMRPSPGPLSLSLASHALASHAASSPADLAVNSAATSAAHPPAPVVPIVAVSGPGMAGMGMAPGTSPRVLTIAAAPARPSPLLSPSSLSSLSTLAPAPTNAVSPSRSTASGPTISASDSATSTPSSTAGSACLGASGIMGAAGGVGAPPLMSFEDMVKAAGLQLEVQRGDGNCLFRAVALQIFGDADMHAEVRRQCLDHMANDPMHFSHFVAENFEAYVARKRKDGVHGNNPEIQALSELYNRPVELFSADEQQLDFIPTSASQSQCNAHAFGDLAAHGGSGNALSSSSSSSSASSSSSTSSVSASSSSSFVSSSSSSASSSSAATPTPGKFKLRPLNIFHGAYGDSDSAPIRLSYHNGNHYNAILDPTAPAVGVGLGLPGLVPGNVHDKQQLQAAMEVSANLALDQTVQCTLEQMSDLEATERELAEAAIAASLTAVSVSGLSSPTAGKGAGALMGVTIDGSAWNAQTTFATGSGSSSSSSASSSSAGSCEPVAKRQRTEIHGSSSVGNPIAGGSGGSSSAPSSTGPDSAMCPVPHAPQPWQPVPETMAPVADLEQARLANLPPVVHEMIFAGFSTTNVLKAFDLVGDSVDDMLSVLTTMLS